MRQRDLAREAEADAGTLGLGRMERPEDARGGVGRDTGAVVLYVDREARFGRLEPQRHARRPGCLRRILQQRP